MGAALKITRTEHSPEELRRLASKCRDGEQVRRLLAIALVLEGHSRTQAAEQNGMERQTLRDWVHHYNESGIDRLLSRESSGRRPFLTQNQRAELKELVIAGPSLESHGVVRWRCVDLQAEVERRFDVRVHESTIGKWLHQLELTRLQPRPRHPKQEPQAQESFKKTSPT
jgi:putative transposase